MMTIPLRGFWDQHRIFSLLLVLFLLILSIFGTFHNLFCTFLSIFCPILSIFCYFLSIFCPIYPAFAFFVHPTLLKFMSPRAASYHNHKNIFFLIIYIKLTIHIVEFYYLEIIFRYLTPLLPNMVNKASKWNWTPTPSNLAYIIL